MYCLVQPVEQLVVEAPELRWPTKICNMAAIRPAIRRGQHPADAQPNGVAGYDRAEQAVLAVVINVAKILVFHASSANSPGWIMRRAPSGKDSFPFRTAVGQRALRVVPRFFRAVIR